MYLSAMQGQAFHWRCRRFVCRILLSSWAVPHGQWHQSRWHRYFNLSWIYVKEGATLSLFADVFRCVTGPPAFTNPINTRAFRLLTRTLSDSPSSSYAPDTVHCLCTKSMVRGASTIPQTEQDWVAKWHQATNRAVKDFLNRASMIDFDVASFMDGYPPNIGIAFSGGVDPCNAEWRRCV